MDKIKNRELLQEFVNSPIKFGLTLEEKEKSFPSSVAACEDNFNIYVSVQDNKVHTAKFDGAGCAISFGATEALLRTIQGMDILETEELLNQYVKFINGEIEYTKYEYLNVFSIIQSHVSRKKCALAPVKAIREAIK